MTLSEKLYNLRRKQGLSQETLAEKLNCSRQAISKWENGKTPDAEMLKKYSILFNVSIDYLLKQDIEEHTSVQPAQKKESNKLLGLGLIISLLGFLSLIVFSAIFKSVKNPIVFTYSKSFANLSSLESIFLPDT